MKVEDIGGLLFVAGIVNLIILIWFIVTLNQIKEYAKIIAEYTRRVAICQPLTPDQTRTLNDALSPVDLVAKLVSEGAKFNLMQGKQDFTIENSELADPELLRMADKCRSEIVSLLVRK